MTGVTWSQQLSFEFKEDRLQTRLISPSIFQVAWKTAKGPPTPRLSKLEM